jgi:hypothetical protein
MGNHLTSTLQMIIMVPLKFSRKVKVSGVGRGNEFSSDLVAYLLIFLTIDFSKTENHK